MLYYIFEKANLCDRMGSVAKGWDWADDSLQRGMSDLFYEMEIFYILIFGGGYTDVYICQNSLDSTYKKG